MGKKKLDVMEKEREIFINGLVEDGKVKVPGCVRNGIDAKSANIIFDEMAEFAKYAFNKSHAAAYAVLSYKTAYLKTYYLEEFLAATMNSYLGNLDKVPIYIEDAKKQGVEVLKRYKEDPRVINAVEAHHDDVPAETPEAILVKAADAISSARPGSRRETLEAYIKRLEGLENIANSFEGVEKSFAIQAGREVRIMVKPEYVNDEEMHLLARDMTKRIEEELEYPGQIKVSIIRETRATDYAK